MSHSPTVWLRDRTQDPPSGGAAGQPTYLVQQPSEVPDDGLVVAYTDNPRRIRELRSGSPSAYVLAVCSDRAPPETVAALLNAGADTCVRADEDPAVVHAHLLALARRPARREPQA